MRCEPEHAVRERCCRCRVMSVTPICGSPKTRSTSSAPRRCARIARSAASASTAALERQEPWGVWGGEIIERGTIIARKRPRGRPRKDTVESPAAA